MQLEAYLKANKLSMGAFATRIGMTRQNISSIIAGKSRPSPDTALAIEAATGGKVKLADLYRPKQP